jgi:hypothetical protein
LFVCLFLAGGSSNDGSSSGSFQFDLKGVLYNGRVVPLAGTAMVLNIGPGDAKVRVGLSSIGHGDDLVQ